MDESINKSGKIHLTCVMVKQAKSVAKKQKDLERRREQQYPLKKKRKIIGKKTRLSMNAKGT